MLRVEFNHDGDGTLTVRLQGRLVGPYAEDARIALERYPARPSILVDLSEVTFVDPFGEQILVWLGRLGASFIAGNLYAFDVCERLQLRLSTKRNGFGAGTDTEVLT
jgi:hypothetical protein